MKAAFPLMLLALLLTLAACRSAEPAPQVRLEDQLVRNHVEAIGGLAALQNVETLQLDAEVYMPAANMTMPLTIQLQRPDLMHVRVSITAMGVEIRNGFDGETAWEDNPMQGGLRKVTGDQARNFKEQADLDGLLVNYQDKGFALQYVGEAEVDGSPARKLRLARPDSSALFIYLDADSHMQVKTEAEGVNPMTGGQATMETVMSDFRDVRGVMMPYLMEVHIDGQLFQSITIKDIQTNVQLDPALFGYPGS